MDCVFFAILPVVLDHAWWTYHANVGDPGISLDSLLGRAFSAGELGVQLFFVISGYVLGLGFYRATNEARGVGLKKYFLWRLRRLEPPYVLIMTIFFVLLLGIGQFGFTEGFGHYPLLSAFSKFWASHAMPGGFVAFLVAALFAVLIVSMVFFVIPERPFMTRRAK